MNRQQVYAQRHREQHLCLLCVNKVNRRTLRNGRRKWNSLCEKHRTDAMRRRLLAKIIA